MVAARHRPRPLSTASPPARLAPARTIATLWFVGFNDALIVGVWVGNDDHSPMNRVVGGSLPAEIGKRFMEQSERAACVCDHARGGARDRRKGAVAAGRRRAGSSARSGARRGARRRSLQRALQRSGMSAAATSAFRMSDCSYRALRRWRPALVRTMKRRNAFVPSGLLGSVRCSSPPGFRAFPPVNAVLTLRSRN